MGSKPLTPFEKAQKDFSSAPSLAKAAEIVWNRTTSGRGMYQRYTTLDKVLKMIRERRWYLSRGDNQNDMREAKRSAAIEKEMRKTYLMCLQKGAGENVAMWGLYGRNNPLAIRISIPRVTIEDGWMRQLANGDELDVKDSKGSAVRSVRFESTVFRDMIYVAIQDKHILDEFDIRRTNTISWEGAKRDFGHGDVLYKEAKRPEFAGWLKDYEWYHERESRLCVRLMEEIPDDSISIAIPMNVVADMRFTFSPWLTDQDIQKAVKAEILKAYEAIGVKIKKSPQRFRRSVLQGMLKLQ